MSSASAVNNNDVCEAERRRPPSSQRKRSKRVCGVIKSRPISHKAAGGKSLMDRWEQKKSILFFEKNKKRRDFVSMAMAVWWLEPDLLYLRDSPQWWNKICQRFSWHSQKICRLESRGEQLQLQKQTLTWWLMMTWRDQFTKINQHSRNDAKIRSIYDRGLFSVISWSHIRPLYTLHSSFCEC